MSNTPFRVIRGTENKISNIPYQDGCVYFASDTKKIYFDSLDKRITMGGNTGIYYGKADFTGMEGPEFIFKIEDLEEDNIPNVNDLILNTEGSFYKVIELFLNDNEIKTEKLTIAGSGGGPGGDTRGKMSMFLVPSSFHSYPYKTIIAGSECKIDFIYNAIDADGNRTGDGRYEILIGGVVRKTGVAKQKKNENDKDIVNTVDLTDFFSLIGSYTVQINCWGNIGGASDTSVSKRIFITSSIFGIQWANGKTTEELEKELNYLDQDFKLSWNVSGDLGNVRTHIIIDDQYLFETENNTFILAVNDLKKIVSHGAHKIEIYATSLINEEEVKSSSIIYNALFIERGRADYIISCKFYRTKIKQYETIQIPVMIYGLNNTTNAATLQFKVNSEEKSQKENCANLSWYQFAYTPVDHGFVPIQFVCGNSIFTLTIEVEESQLTIEEVKDYEFKFKATDFSNDEEIKSWSCKGSQISFSDTFDWHSGGLQTGIDDPDGNGPYFKVPAGSYMTIPYNLFNNTIASSGKGANFKMIFKVVGCQDYDTTIAKILDPNNDNIGLRLKAQNSYVSDGNITSVLRYCEDTYIEYEYDYVYNANNKAERYLISWIDGVPSKISLMSSNNFTTYINNENLVIGSEDCDIYIYLIKFYARHLDYKEHLNNFIMDASSADIMMERYVRNNVYSKDPNGDDYIAYDKVATNNPNCNVYIYEIPKIPTSKNDIVDNTLPESQDRTKCCKFIHYLGDPNTPLHQFDNVKMRAQGTSSMSYGISAYNLDTKFEEEWSLDDEAIPVNYFNTKTNVASCEEANNALNQEWYNRFQPYKTKKRLEVRNDGKVARDTMEFKPGVLFLKDKNKTINDNTNVTNNNVFKEIKGYVDQPYPRLYSICNMGNSKKNVEVFHGAGNDYECCVENTDNNSAGHQMLVIGGIYNTEINQKTYSLEIPLNLPDDLFDAEGYVIEGKDWGTTDINMEVTDPDTGEIYQIIEQDISNEVLWNNAMDSIFEFRYIKDENRNKECGRRFLRLVNWFVKNNPANFKALKDIEALSEGEKELYRLNSVEGALESFKFKGVKKSGVNDNYPSDYEVLGNSNLTIASQNFEFDCKEYRAAKMLRECEDYLIMDSIIFHYLFIERHTMSDNVSKNTFWNTEDGKHWDLTKNYDNDTSDGIDNNGDLLFDYGYEIMDKSTLGASVFNDGFTSAWLNFIYYIPSNIKRYVYRTLAARGAWKAETYLKLFKDEWQDYIPEACWIESFRRKYLRPLEVYGNDGYLSRLDNGKKTHQRKQYEIYQEQYMDSKYWNLSESSNIQWRSTEPDESNRDKIYFYATLYADGYVVGAIASGHNPNISQRAKKGERVQVSYVPGGALNDATGYLYFPSLFTKLEDLECVKPQKLDVSLANKLKTLQLDASKNNLQNNILSQNTADTGARLSLNSNIQEIIIQNCSKINFGIDLEGNKRLTKLDLSGSTFNSISVMNSPVQTLFLHNPNTLKLINLNYLTLNETNENETKGFKMNDYSNIVQLELNNIDFDINNQINSKNLSKYIVDKIIEQGAKDEDGKYINEKLTYLLNNVGWIFNENDGIVDNSIPVLDTLLKQKPSAIVQSQNSLALTGFGRIPSTAYNGNNALALYEKYGLTSADFNSYPYFILDFENKLYTIDIKDGNGKIIWSRQIASYNDVTNNILKNGAYGEFNAAEAIKKLESATTTYTFDNKWKYTFKDGTTGTISSELINEYFYLDLAKLPKDKLYNVIIEPVYKEETRYYTVEFKYKSSEDSFYSATNLEYGTPFSDIKPTQLPIKDDSLLPLTDTYWLKGYSSIENTFSVINENNWKVTDNVILYPVFDIKSVYDIDYSDCFNIIYKTTTINGVEGSYKTINGLKTVLDGNYYYIGNKITIPNDIIIINSSAFSSREQRGNITNFFIGKNSMLYQIEDNAFSNSYIEYFDFNNAKNLKEIHSEAFLNNSFSPDKYDRNIYLPSGLKSIGSSAFNNSMKKNENSITMYIPSSVQTLEQYAIAHWENQGSIINIGGERDFSALRLEGEKPKIRSNNTDGTKDIAEVNFYTSTPVSPIDLAQWFENIKTINVINQ